MISNHFSLSRFVFLPPALSRWITVHTPDLTSYLARWSVYSSFSDHTLGLARHSLKLKTHDCLFSFAPGSMAAFTKSPIRAGHYGAGLFSVAPLVAFVPPAATGSIAP